MFLQVLPDNDMTTQEKTLSTYYPSNSQHNKQRISSQLFSLKIAQGAQGLAALAAGRARRPHRAPRGLRAAQGGGEDGAAEFAESREQ